MTNPPSPPSWTRRFSHPALPLPTLPNISAFRAALLGYLGEVEASLQSHPSSPVVVSPPVDTDGQAGSSTALPGPSTSLRQRNGEILPGVLHDTNLSLLQHLSSLREDVAAYLPSRLSVPVPPGIGPSREWLRSLPSKLSIVDLGVGSLEGEGQVRAAQRRVIELVHALLPSEDWAGWESLGWTDEERDGEEDDEEPEYLFPFRTPASTKALANRRRAVRSKSLSYAWSDKPELRLVRSRTEPSRESWFTPTVDNEPGAETDEGEPDAVEVVETPELGDTKLTAAVAPSSNLGPTLSEALARSKDGRRLIEYDDLPFGWRNNEHIVEGYRFIPLYGTAGPIPLIASAFAWHNETVNIHSHFIPTIFILLIIPAIMYSSPLPNAHPLDTATLVVYLLAAVSCLVSSAGWHVLSGCASRRWFEWGACVDYIGISWLIAASFGTVVYNGFYCHPTTVLFYSSTNLACGILGSYLPFQKWFNERRHKNWRIAFFLFLCFAMVTPMIQMFYLHGFRRAHDFVSPFGISIITYVIGLVFYAMHLPECIWPGKFNYWGSSHQIWHLAIVLAIILHYRAIFVAHKVRYDYSCAVSDAGRPVGEVVEELMKVVWAALRGMIK